MLLSQYFIDNFFYELHKNGLIVIDSGDSLNTTLFVSTINSTAGLSGTFDGFNASAPCKVILSSMDPYPQFQLHKNISDFKSNMRIDLWCKRNDTEEDPYEYCAAFSFLINFSTHVYVTQEPVLVMNFTLSKLALSINKVIESKVG